MTKISVRAGRSSAPTALHFLGLSSVFGLALISSTAAALASPFTAGVGTPKAITFSGLAAAQKTETPSQASPDGKALTFRRKLVRLVAVTGPDNDMLSYRINGKRNPTLVVSPGTTIKMLFVNTDDDMKHNVRFGTALKAYPNVMISYLKTSVGTPELAHKSKTAFYGEELTLCAPASAGTFVYLCTVRGHAQGGMVGKGVVR